MAIHYKCPKISLLIDSLHKLLKYFSISFLQAFEEQYLRQLFFAKMWNNHEDF